MPGQAHRHAPLRPPTSSLLRHLKPAGRFGQELQPRLRSRRRPGYELEFGVVSGLRRLGKRRASRTSVRTRPHWRSLSRASPFLRPVWIASCVAGHGQPLFSETRWGGSLKLGCPECTQQNYHSRFPRNGGKKTQPWPRFLGFATKMHGDFILMETAKGQALEGSASGNVCVRRSGWA